MVTDKQLQANIENARKGGVKTPEGKAISRLNAMKHGILSKEVLLEGENEQGLIELGKRIRNDLKPQGEIEVLLVERIISNYWRLRRSLSVEKALMEWEQNFELESVHFYTSKEEQVERKAIKKMIANEDIARVSRYETMLERSIYKALHELQRLQAAKLGEKTPLPLAIDVTIDKETDEN